MSNLRFLVILLCLLSNVNTTTAQKGDKSYMIMSSHGYMRAEREIFGSGHMNTFLYSPNNLWAYGGEFGVSQGRSYFQDIDRMLNLSLAPCVYAFILNNNRHQVYLGASLGFGISYIEGYRHQRTLRMDFGSSAGYNYKFKRHWMIGPRLYHNYNLFDFTFQDDMQFSIMALISLGYRF